MAPAGNSSAVVRRVGAAQQAEALGGGDSEVLFEGDPSHLTDVEGILESIASTMGIPTVRKAMGPIQQHFT